MLTFAEWRSPIRPSPIPPSLSWFQSAPTVRTSPILGMCSDPPRYYNLINRQVERPLYLPPPRAVRLFCCL